MLVLSRKQGQRIVVGDTVITISQIKGSRVRVGVDAPRGVPITRGELIERRYADLEAGGGLSLDEFFDRLQEDQKQ